MPRKLKSLDPLSLDKSQPLKHFHPQKCLVKGSENLEDELNR